MTQEKNRGGSMAEMACEEWRVVDCNGVVQDVNGIAFSDAMAREFAAWHDQRFPQVAPHRVMRVCLKPVEVDRG